MRKTKFQIYCSVCAIMFAIGFISCSTLTPSPEVRVISVNPLNVIVSDTTGGTDINVTFTNKNKVDAVITSEQVTELSSVNPDAVLTRYAARPLSFYVLSKDTATIMTITFTKQWKISYLSYLASKGRSSLIWRFVWRGTDVFGYNKGFSDSIHLDLIRY